MSITYLKKSLSSPSIKVISVDFFDTLIWRKFHKPIDLFLLLGEILIEENLLSSPRTANAFSLLRIEAEKYARQVQVKSHGLTEVSLSQIYASFPKKTFNAPLEKIERLELEIEKNHIVFDKNLVEVLKSVIISKKIVICSDTYFSECHLQYFLLNSGIPRNLFSKIFVSSEWGLSKSEGLLAKVIQTCKILPDQLLHIGDHPYKDGDSAKRVGAIYIRYPEIEAYGTYSENRFRKMASICSKTKPFLESDGGVWGLSRRFTTTLSDYSLDSLEPELVAYTYGSMFCGFADWIGRETQDFSPDIIFCPTREGVFLSQFLNQYFQLIGIKAEAENFLTSRAALLKGSFFTGSLKEIEKFCLSRRLPITIRRFASIFNLDIEKFYSPPKYLDYPLRRGCKITQEILGFFASNSEFKSALVQKSSDARNRLLAYFKQIVSTKLKHPTGSSLKILVADVGWTGTSQKILESILKTRYPLIEVRGRYLMLENGALNNAFSGINLEGWLVSLGESSDFGNVIMPVKELLEQLLMADMPSVIDYTELGNPIFSEVVGSTPILQKLQIKRLQNLIKRFLQHYMTFRQKTSRESKGIYLGDKEELFRTSLAAQAYNPDPKEFDFFRRWEHEDNNNAFVNEKIVDEFQEIIFQYATLREIYRTPSYWHLGNIYRNYRSLSDRLFLQQLIGNYGIDDVYDRIDISYCAVNVSGEVLNRQEAIIEITCRETGILVVHCFSEFLVKFQYKNESHKDLRVEKILVESFDVKKHQISSFILNPDRHIVNCENLPPLDVEVPVWKRGSELELNLLDVLKDLRNSSCELTVILCIRIV